MQRQLNILIFAYVFPPDAGSGTYRTLYFSNNWAQQGDNITLVTVKEADFARTALIDYNLCTHVHPSIHVVRASAKRPLDKLLAARNAFVHHNPAKNDVYLAGGTSRLQKLSRACRLPRSFKDTITDLFSCPDEHVGWIPDALRCGHRIIKEKPIDCIYATGGPWSCLLAATILHKGCGIPLLLDFRDPWIANPNLLVKSRLSRSLQTIMERHCVKCARKVVANTEELRFDFIERYPCTDPATFVTVTNGFEDILRVSDGSTAQFNLVHAGALYQSRNPINLLKAATELVKDGVIAADTFRIKIVGGTSLIDRRLEAELDTKILDKVLEIIPWVPHEEALSIQQQAGALVILQTGFPLQVPRKLYEYLSIGRPILAIAEPHSATARLVNDLSIGYTAVDAVESIKMGILTVYDKWKAGEGGLADANRLYEYSNRVLSGKLRDIMLGF